MSRKNNWLNYLICHVVVVAISLYDGSKCRQGNGQLCSDMVQKCFSSFCEFIHPTWFKPAKKKTAQGVKVATVPIKFKSDRFNVVNGSASFDGGFYQKFYIKSFYYE